MKGQERTNRERIKETFMLEFYFLSDCYILYFDMILIYHVYVITTLYRHFSSKISPASIHSTHTQTPYHF